MQLKYFSTAVTAIIYEEPWITFLKCKVFKIKWIFLFYKNTINK